MSVRLGALLIAGLLTGACVTHRAGLPIRQCHLITVEDVSGEVVWDCGTWGRCCELHYFVGCWNAPPGSGIAHQTPWHKCEPDRGGGR